MTDILPLLIAERDRLNRAIEALQGPLKRRGRPPKNPVAVLAPAASATPRKGMSAAARRAQSERKQKYWAARRLAKASASHDERLVKNWKRHPPAPRGVSAREQAQHARRPPFWSPRGYAHGRARLPARAPEPARPDWVTDTPE